MALRRST